MTKITVNIDEMTEQQAKNCLKKLIRWLDELDGDDYFGMEGWAKMSSITE